MVFEAVVTDLLNRFLGNYIQNLDSSQLKVGIWGGDVILKNLIFKENALDDLNLPLKAAYGQLENLALNIPWKNIYTAPVKVVIDGLNLLVVPKPEVLYDPHKEEKIAWDIKQQQLKRLEEAKRIEEQSKKPKDSQQDSFTEKLITQVIKNLQVKIKQIHVRYEDNVSNPGHPFAFGITLHDLSFESTDENWKVGIVKDATKIIYKLVALQGFAVYLNSQTKLFSHLNKDEKKHAFKNGIATPSYKPVNTDYVLGPINSTLKLQLNQKPEQDGSNYSIPKIMVIFILEELTVGLTKYQYQNLLILSQSLEWMEISARYQKYRPQLPYKGNAPQWWTYAYECILNEDVKRRSQNWSWEHIRTHRIMCREYKELYKQKLSGKKLANEVQFMDLEKNLDIFNLSLMRKQADMEFERSGEKKKDEKKSSGWFGGWFGGKETKKEEKSIAKQFEDAMTAEEKAKLWDAIGYQANATAAKYPREFVENKFAFELKKLIVTVSDDSRKPVTEVMCLSLNNVLSTVEQRPSAQALKVIAKVEALTVMGLKKLKEPRYSLVTTQNTEKDKTYSLLDVFFETNPLDGKCDQRLRVNSSPLEIVYYAETINELVTVLKPPKSVEIYSKLQSAATETFAGIKEVSAASFQYAIEHHKYLELNLDLKAPYIIIPENGVMKENVSVLLLDMGSLKMQSMKREKDASYIPNLHKMGKSQEEIQKEMIAQAYDKYTISLNGIQILFAAPNENWKEARTKTSTKLHIWQPTNVKVILEKSVILDDPRIPKLKVHGSLPKVHITLSDARVLELMKLALSIPTPKAEPEEIMDQPTTTKLKLTKPESHHAVHDLKKVSVPESKPPAPIEGEKQLTDLELKFEIGQIQLTITQKQLKAEKDFFQFLINRMGLSMQNRTLSMTVDVYLGDISLSNLQHKTPAGNVANLVHTKLQESKGSKLLNISYLNVDKKHPSLKSIYQNTLQKIEVNFSTLILLLHQEALLSMMQFSNNLMAQIEDVKKKSEPESVKAVSTMTKRASMTSLQSIIGDKLVTTQTGAKRRRKRKDEELIDLQVVAKLGSLNVEICNNIKNILELSISGLEAEVEIQKQKMVISNVLRKIEVIDPTDGAIHPRIVSFSGNDVFDVKIIMFHTATEGAGYLDMTKVDTSVSANLGCIRIIFLNKFVMDCLDFLSNFQEATAKVKEATVKAAEAAMENVSSVIQKASRVLLSIKMKAPVLIMPRNSTSNEVLLLDMGQLKISNQFTIGTSAAYSSTTPPLLETMEVRLQRFKMARALLNPTLQTETADCLLVEPTSFVITFKRNLSASWCKDIPEMDISGHFTAISLTMSHEDYGIIMRTLNENLNESTPAKTEESVEPVVTSSEPTKVLTSKSADTKKLAAVSEVYVEEDQEDTPVYTRLKFNFVLDSVRASLYLGTSNLDNGTVVRNPATALTYFEVHVIATKGEMSSDNSMWANVVVVNFIIDDVRQESNTCFPRLMEKKTKETADSMLDVTYRKDNNNNTYVDVKVRSFLLVAAPNYLMSISKFFTTDAPGVDSGAASPAPLASPETFQQPTTVAQQQVPSVNIEVQQEAKGTFVLMLAVDQPDIVLIEDETNANTEALILNHTVTFKMKSTPQMLSLSGTIKDLQIISCCFNPELRKSTQTEILSPCEISISGCTPAGEGMHVDVDINDIELHMAPATVQLLTSIAGKFTVSEETGEKEEAAEIDLSNLWAVQNVMESKFWFLKPELGIEAMEPQQSSQAVKPRSEQLIIKAKTVLITVEIGVGTQTVPMLLLETGFFADVQDWSSALSVTGGLTLEMLSYNEKLALWEPFIERIDTNKASRPWELTLEMKTSTESSQAIDVFEQDLEEVGYETPKMSLTVVANDVMDLCITKTSIEVLTNLGQAFSDAVHLVSAPRKEVAAPFIIRNDTGLPITLLLKSKEFLDEGWEWTLQLASDDKPRFKKETKQQAISEIVLENNTSVPLLVKTNKAKESTSKKSVLKFQDMTSDKQLLIKVVEMNASRYISVKKADKRFFQLPQKTYPGDHWGLVSDIKATYGCKTVTLRSVIQVKNFFKGPIEVYYMAAEGEELICCGTVEPAATFNVPLHAVYTSTSEIFFRPKNEKHKFSSTSFIWKELVKNPTYCKKLECASKAAGEKSFFINVIGEIDQIFFEDTKKKTLASTGYILNLKPTAVLTNLLPIDILCSDQSDKDEQKAEGGESMELSWVEVDHSSINVKLQNYIGQIWTCTKIIESSVAELSVWSFETVDTPKLTMDLGMYTENDHNSLSLSLYCPFWMINKTSLPLKYKKSKFTQNACVPSGSSQQADDMNNVISHPGDVEGPILFSFRAKNFFARKKAALKIGESEWSDKFSIDVVGSSGTVKCFGPDRLTQEVGVQIKLTKIKLTKIVIFMPYYLIVNNCTYDLEFIEQPSQNWIVINAGDCMPFWPKQSKTREMAVRVKGTREKSKVFSFGDPDTILLRLPNKYGGVQVDCQVNEASDIITFSEYRNGSATIRLVNCLAAYTINYHQSQEKDAHHALKPQETVLYTWDNPSGTKELVWNVKGTKEIRSNLLKDSIGEMALEGANPIYWVLFLDDIQRTLLFTEDIVVATRSQCAGEFERADQDIIVSFRGFGVSLVDNINRSEVIYVAVTSSGVVWEACKEKSRRYKPLKMDASLIIENAYQRYITDVRTGGSPEPKMVLEHKIEVDFQQYMMIKPTKRKIRRSFQTGLWCNYKTSPHRVQLHAKINRLQIDNQMTGCVFPVIFAPVPPPKTVAADSEPKPFTEVSIMMRKSDFSDLRQYKYFKVLIQEFHIKVDQAFINGIMGMFVAEESGEDAKTSYMLDLKAAEVDLKDVAEIQMGQDQPNFYDLLHFSPLKVHISFSMQGFGSSDSTKSVPLSSNFLNLFVQSVGVTLTEIQDVIFKLAYFERQNKFVTQKQLISEAIKHYSGQAIKQMYVLVLGLDVIGNPFGLVIGLTRGVEDLFYEPIQGAIQGPEEFAEGLALGVKSLFGHAVGGAAGAVSRITGTLGKGVAALTLDENYQRRRREAQLQRSANFQEGLAQSGKGLVMGVFDGVTGVFTKPIEGAKEEGMEGFLKGMGKGVVGLVTRPTAGVIDFASGTLDSVKRIAENTSEVQRYRAPRFFQADGMVRPYNKHESEGYQLLQDIEKGKFLSTDNYVAHAALPPDGKHIVLITDKRILMVIKGDIFGQWNCDWQVTWDEMKGTPIASEKGVVISLKEPRKKKLGIFGSGENTRLIQIKNPELSSWIAEKMEEAMEKQD